MQSKVRIYFVNNRTSSSTFVDIPQVLRLDDIAPDTIKSLEKQLLSCERLILKSEHKSLKLMPTNNYLVWGVTGNASSYKRCIYASSETDPDIQIFVKKKKD